MQILTLLGIVFQIFLNVFLSPGAYEEVYIAWKGLDRISPSHHKEIISFYKCDNYILDSKAEENPRYSSLSVRPEVSTFLNDAGGAVRGLFQYRSPTGDDALIMCNTNTIFRSSGTVWVTLETGTADSPWEGVLYSDPNVTHLYLANGADENKKYLATGQDLIFDMQNQDDETEISGNMWFTQSALIATGDAVAIASLEAGQYIKYATGGSDIEWNEITSIEGVTVEFSAPYVGTTGSQSAVVRSNDVENSRYILEYEGHMVTGYTSVSATSQISNTEVATQEYLMRRATGIAQSFEATSNNISAIKLKMYRSAPITGDLVLKLKDSIDATEPMAEIRYPVGNIPLTATDITFNFGSVAVTSGDTYFLTIERETSGVGSGLGFIHIKRGSAYANGNSYWTYNADGFDSSWDVGYTTLEVTPVLGLNFALEPDTYIDSANATTNYSDATSLYVGNYSGNARKSLLHYYAEYDCVKNDVENWTTAEVSVYKTSTTTGELKAYRIITYIDPASSTWNDSWSLGTWSQAGCSSPETDYQSAGVASLTDNTTVTGYITFDVTAIATWTVYPQNGALTNGIVITGETVASTFEFSSAQAASNQPKWLLTTQTGASDSSDDLFFEVLSEASNRATVMYSKRFKPENFPVLNTFDIPGRIVALAKTGGYLVVAGREPDALHFYRFTGEVTDGDGIEFVTRINGLTIGSSKTIAMPPTDDSFLFFSGLGIYRQKGLQTSLLSGKIREEAKLFANYRDPRDYYGGSGNVMPQGVILPTKDTYVITAPTTLSVNSFLYNLNYATDTWFRWADMTATALLVRESGGSEPRLYLGYDSGQVYRLDTSGSTSNEAELQWFFSGTEGRNDITKNKTITYMDIWAVADNPLRSCVVTLEVKSTDPYSTFTQTSTLTLETGDNLPAITDNVTSENMVWLKFPFTKKAREFHFTLTQQATQGALSLRSIRYKYKVEAN
jgi:hypothetical protein